MAKLTELYVNIGAKTDKLKQGLNSAEKQVSTFGRTVNNIGGLIAGAFAVSKISAFVGETIKLASEAEGVAAAFERIATPGLLNELRKSTKGTVSDLELMKAAVQANNFQIPLQQLGSLLEFANKRAQDTGQSVDYLVNSIVMGIGRKSPLILDNLGISATKLREKLGDAGAEVRSVADVAKAVADIANEEMAKSGGIIETNAIKLQQLNAEWKNTKEIIGKMLIPVVGQLVTVMNKAIRGWQNILNPQRLVAESASDEIQRITESLQGLSQEDALKKLQWELTVIKNASAELSNKKFMPFSRGLREANQQLSIYAETSKWLKQLFFDAQKIEQLRSNIPENITQQTPVGGKKRPGLLQPLSMMESPMLDNKQLEEYTEKGMKIVDMNNKIARSTEGMNESYVAFADSLMGMGAQAENFKEFAKVAVNSARQFVAAQLAKVVAKQIENAINSSGGNPYVALIAGAAVGGATAAMFNSIVPKLAQGGMTTGPTLAMVGDNPSGKELIIPLEKLGKNQQKMPELALRGRDLYWMYKNEADFRNKVI